MRYDAQHKQRTRASVLAEASRAIRQHGPDKVGVAALMAKAGLTHGGFYAHFASRDDLVAQAIATMFEAPARLFNSATEGVAPAKGLIRYIDAYLSMAHRDGRDAGCPVAALCSDMARMSGQARENFDAGLRSMVERLATLIAALPGSHTRDLASAITAQMVGALTLARAVQDPDAARQMLQACRASVLAQLGLDGA